MTLIDKLLARYLRWRGWAMIPPLSKEPHERLIHFETEPGSNPPVIYVSGRWFDVKPRWDLQGREIESNTTKGDPQDQQ